MPEVIMSGSGTQYPLIINSDGSISTSVAGDSLIQRIDYDGGNAPVYLGYAAPGTSSGSASWQLKKLEYDDGMTTAILFGSGNTNFDKVWNSRSGTAEVYS